MTPLMRIVYTENRNKNEMKLSSRNLTVHFNEPNRLPTLNHQLAIQLQFKDRRRFFFFLRNKNFLTMMANDNEFNGIHQLQQGQ